MKVTLEFDLSEEKEEFQDCMKASEMKCALNEIAQQIFRPARKHGFNDKELNDLIAKCEQAEEIIGLLETKFFEILKEYEISL